MRNLELGNAEGSTEEEEEDTEGEEQKDSRGERRRSKVVATQVTRKRQRARKKSKDTGGRSDDSTTVTRSRTEAGEATRDAEKRVELLKWTFQELAHVDGRGKVDEMSVRSVAVSDKNWAERMKKNQLRQLSIRWEPWLPVEGVPLGHRDRMWTVLMIMEARGQVTLDGVVRKSQGQQEIAMWREELGARLPADWRETWGATAVVTTDLDLSGIRLHPFTTSIISRIWDDTGKGGVVRRVKVEEVAKNMKDNKVGSDKWNGREATWAVILLMLAKGWARASWSDMRRNGRKWWHNRALIVAADLELYDIREILQPERSGEHWMRIIHLLVEQPQGSAMWNMKPMQGTQHLWHSTSWCKHTHVYNAKGESRPHPVQKDERIMSTTERELQPPCRNGKRCGWAMVNEGRHEFVLAPRKQDRKLSELPGGMEYWKNAMPSQIMKEEVKHQQDWYEQHVGRECKVLVMEPCGGTGSAGMEARLMNNVVYQTGPEKEKKLRTPDGKKPPDLVGDVLDWDLEKNIEEVEKRQLENRTSFDTIMILAPVPCGANSTCSLDRHQKKHPGHTSRDGWVDEKQSQWGASQPGLGGEERRDGYRVLRAVVKQFDAAYKETWKWMFVEADGGQSEGDEDEEKEVEMVGEDGDESEVGMVSDQEEEEEVVRGPAGGRSEEE
jgi:hypothetical protein